jgi:hypothetical protein
VLRKIFGKSRAEMTLDELEAVIGWLDRNRIGDHLHLLQDDPQYRWSAETRSGRVKMGRRWV